MPTLCKNWQNINRKWNPLLPLLNLGKDSEWKRMQNGGDKTPLIQLLKSIKLNVLLCLSIQKLRENIKHGLKLILTPDTLPTPHNFIAKHIATLSTNSQTLNGR